MVHYAVCQLHSEADIKDLHKLCVVFEAETVLFVNLNYAILLLD